MKKKKIVRYSILGLIAACALAFGLGMADLGWLKFFGPRKENIRREVFEQTKSYVHGKTQDLAKYYEEYQKAQTVEDKEAISNLIKISFSDFDANTINTVQLRSFLVSIRGY